VVNLLVMPEFSPPDTCEQLLAQMVSIETVNPAFGGPVGGEPALAAYLEKLAHQWGLKTRRSAVADGLFNLLITTEVAPDAEWLLFESHLDTVSVDGMTVAPFAMTTVGERLHGRGTCDTKGSGAAMLWALQAYARSAHRSRNAGIIFTVDEEAAMRGAQAFAPSWRTTARCAGAPSPGALPRTPPILARAVRPSAGCCAWSTRWRPVSFRWRTANSP